MSVPAYFDNLQRGALIEAAKLAGLTVVRLIGEATAAALAVQAQPTEVQRILVMDMGADQFTVSLLQRVEGTPQIMQQAVANHLGGNDFAHALVADFAAGAHLTGIDTIAYQQLFDQVAELKKKLSKQWIPVEERLPEENEDVLVFYTNNEIQVDFIGEDGDWFWEDREDGIEVIAWMPLPEGYRPE